MIQLNFVLVNDDDDDDDPLSDSYPDPATAEQLILKLTLKKQLKELLKLKMWMKILSVTIILFVLHQIDHLIHLDYKQHLYLYFYLYWLLLLNVVVVI